jgi:AcrR family transcriptional regulator
LTRKQYQSIVNAIKAGHPKSDIEDRLLDAADRLLARHGYRKMTMDDLADEVGLGKGTIYLHFPRKEDVILAHIDRVMRRLLGNLQRIAVKPSSSVDKICDMLLARVMYRFDSVRHFTESLSEMLRDIRPVVLKRRQQYFEAETVVFAGEVKKGQKRGEFRLHDCAGTAWSLIEATNSLLPFNLSARELGERAAIEERTGRITNLLLNGLRARSGRTARSFLPSRPGPRRANNGIIFL